MRQKADFIGSRALEWCNCTHLQRGVAVQRAAQAFDDESK
jgi:hypothetical protein